MNHRQWLLIQAQRHEWKRGAELGVRFGATLDLLLSHISDLHMIGVDDFKVRPGYEDWDHERHLRAASDTVGRYPGRAQLLVMNTLQAAEQIEDGSLDFVFIDADHSTAAVIADIAAWRSKVKPGGMLCGDDANKTSVRRALDCVVPQWKRDGRCWSDG